MILVIIFFLYISRVMTELHGPKRLERVFNGLDHYNNPGVLSNPSVESVESKVCKNCKTNKALDDGFDLCGMCKENPKWWVVG